MGRVLAGGSWEVLEAFAGPAQTCVHSDRGAGEGQTRETQGGPAPAGLVGGEGAGVGQTKEREVTACMTCRSPAGSCVWVRLGSPRGSR